MQTVEGCANQKAKKVGKMSKLTEHTKYKKETKEKAIILRKNMTPEERQLWYNYLNKFNPKIYRQRPIGKYIADFYCPKAKLVIEIDGIQHLGRRQTKHDLDRNQYLNSIGIEVIRIPNERVFKDFEMMCSYIERTIKSRLF